MKVLHVINNLGSGGAEKLLVEILPLLNKIKGLQADVLLLTDKNNVFQKNLEEYGVKVKAIPLKSIYNPLNIFYIRRYIIKGEYDLVHVHLFPSLYWTSLATRLIFRKKPKLIVTEHSTNNRRRNKKIFRYLDKFIYKNYDKIISISQKAQVNLIDWLTPKKNSIQRFDIVENGININKYKEASPYKKSEINKNFTEDTKLLCMVARFTEAKDQKTVIKAINLLPEKFHLLLVGDGELKSECRELAIKLGVYNRVHFLGFRNDIEKILKTSDFIILSSYWEGLSLSSIEGMASGKPFIASDAPGLREVVEGAGALFPIGDYKVLASIILELESDKKKYDKLAEKCIMRSEDFSIENTLTNYISIYEGTLKKC